MKSFASRCLLVLVAVCALSGAAAAADSRPSIVLIVIDTLRVDAVSSYGKIAGTTPEVDALAREGLRYEHAYAPAPWTLPSHATILSGLGVEQHRAGISGRGGLRDEVVTLAERLRDAGYETAAFSENTIVSDLFGLVQGFQRHRATQIGVDGKGVYVNAVSAVKDWLPKRNTTRPFFLFLNIVDPHSPYTIRAENRFVPPDASQELIRSRPQNPSHLLCGGIPDQKMLGVLHGLYLGDVHAADAKVGEIAQAIRAATSGRKPIIVVAADHGEYFGEERLMGHEFGLHEAVLHVPLIVNGLPGIAPSVIPDTVGLVDLAPTILGWAGIRIPADLPGKPLPRQSAGGPGDRAIFAFYSDTTHWFPKEWREHEVNPLIPYDQQELRQFCTESDPVWGAMAAVIQYPHKFLWYERRKPALFDLSWDAGQKSDQAAYQPKQIDRYTREVEPHVRAAGLTDRSPSDGPTLSKEALDALRALGYAK